VALLNDFVNKVFITLETKSFGSAAMGGRGMASPLQIMMVDVGGTPSVTLPLNHYQITLLTVYLLLWKLNFLVLRIVGKNFPVMTIQYFGNKDH
jgi:hypothetical protein